MSESHELACQLAAYVPLTLVKQLVNDGLPEPGHGRSLTAATLFADISGFTLMSEELAMDGRRGAEELNRVLPNSKLNDNAIVAIIFRFLPGCLILF